MVRRRRVVAEPMFLPAALLAFDEAAWPGECTHSRYSAFEAAVRAHVASQEWLRVNPSLWLRAVSGVRRGRLALVSAVRCTVCLRDS